MSAFRCLRNSGLLSLTHRSATTTTTWHGGAFHRAASLAWTTTTTTTSYPYQQQQRQQRAYTPLTPEEEEKEKARVAGLSEFAREQELRKLNRDIARLSMLRGINTGELYTWTGKYKALARDYGFPLVAWYWSIWGLTAVACYVSIEVGGIDAMNLIAQADIHTGWDLSSKIDPNLGKIGLVLVVNEMIEPLRLPVVIVTVKPVMDRLFPPKF